MKGFESKKEEIVHWKLPQIYPILRVNNRVQTGDK